MRFDKLTTIVYDTCSNYNYYILSCVLNDALMHQGFTVSRIRRGVSGPAGDASEAARGLQSGGQGRAGTSAAARLPGGKSRRGGGAAHHAGQEAPRDRRKRYISDFIVYKKFVRFRES